MKEDTALVDNSEMICERAEMWAWAAMHMRPEPITLTDMRLDDESLSERQAVPTCDTGRESRYTYWSQVASPRLPPLNKIVQSLSRMMWVTVYGVGKTIEYVRLQGGRAS